MVSVQLRFLRLLSKEAAQNFTYHCKNSVAYKDEKNSNLKKALVLKASDGQDIKAYSSNRLKYTVISDGCSVCFDSFKTSFKSIKKYSSKFLTGSVHLD